MSDLSLTASRLPAAPSAISAAAITATVPDPPRNFTALDNGTILRGTVQGRDKDGLIAVKTDQGILKIATNVNLQPGSHVTMEVRSVGDRLQVVVLAVDQAAATGSAAAELLAGAGPANTRQTSGAPHPASAGGQAAGTASPPDHAERAAAGVASKETAPATVIVAGTRLTAIVIHSVPRDLIQGAAQQLPPATDEVQLAPRSGSTVESRPAEQPPAFTAEFRPTPPPPISASLLPEIHDRIAALFAEPAETSAQAADPAAASSPAATPAGLGAQVGPLTLNPEIRERIIALFVGSPSEAPAEAATPSPAPVVVPSRAISPGTAPSGTAPSPPVPTPPAPAKPVVPAVQPRSMPDNGAPPEAPSALPPSPSSSAPPIPAGTATVVGQTLEQAHASEAPLSPLPPARPPSGQIPPLGDPSAASPPSLTDEALLPGQAPAQQTVAGSSPQTITSAPPASTASASVGAAPPPPPASPGGPPAVGPNSTIVPPLPPAAVGPAAPVPVAAGDATIPAGQPLPPPSAPNTSGDAPLPPAAAPSSPNPASSGGASIPLDPTGGGTVTIPPIATAPVLSAPEADPVAIPPGGIPVSTTPVPSPPAPTSPLPTTAPLVIPPLIPGLGEAGQDGAPSSLPGTVFSSLPANTGQVLQDQLVSTSPVSPTPVIPPLPAAPVQSGPAQTNPGDIGGQTPATATVQPDDARRAPATGPANAAAEIIDTAGSATTLNAIVSSSGKLALGASAAPAVTGSVQAGAAQAAAQAEYQTISTLGEVTSATGELTGKQLPSGPLPTGTELRLRVLNIQQPALGGGQAASIQLAATAGGKSTVVGQILGHTPAGHPVIHSSLGDLVLQQQATLPVGATITLAVEAMDMASAASALAIPVTPQMTALNLAQGWPTLLDLLVTLQHGAASAAGGGDPADPAVIAHLAQPGSKLAASMNAAMDAFRAGDFEKLFGALGSTLKSGGGKQETVRKLRDEFTQLSMLAQDRPQQDWRCFFLPLWDDGRLQQINLFYRRQRRGQSGDKDKGDDATRFVVEVNFTRLGGCQLDGLIRKKHFDLMIRSHQELPLAIKRDLAGLFAQARELGNYAGDISFQTTARFPVTPLDDIAKDAPSVTA